LRSILLFDTTPEVLGLTAEILTQMLAIVTGHPVVSVTLGTWEAEDDLWGRLGLSGDSGEQSFDWKPGLLTAGQNQSELRLVIIPDLTKLSLASARACVTLMGADVAHLERHGQQEFWQPHLCWLAGCASEQVGMVSPHLLDRFALRLSGQVEKTRDRVAEILEWIDLSPSPSTNKNSSLLLSPVRGEREGWRGEPDFSLKRLRQPLQNALRLRPTITAEATARILDYTSILEMYSPRREITLGRLALAKARLEGVAEMRAKDVDAAAHLMGLKPIPQQTEDVSKESAEPVTPQFDQPETGEDKSTTTSLDSNPPKPATVRESVYESDEPEPLPPTRLPFNTAPVNPYPEDEAPVEREAASLQLPSRRFRSRVKAYGAIIGVEKARTLQDLALVRTLLEAAKFQGIRHQSTGNGHQGLIVSPTDLHSYRRTPVAEQMLMLLLDHTCLRDCQWQDELLPYLSWAYVERASVCLIQVGAENAHHELRAQKIMAQSILVPRISAGIEAGWGKATPLAHGLDLALQTLRHALQHGRSTVQQAVLVVISDGRGNVPLAASRLGQITPPVGRKGVEDALQVAERIRGLDNVKVVLLNPQPKQYQDLPLELAQVMGAAVVSIPPLQEMEVE
jgi:magnesium chelatase subunit D